MTRSSDKRWFMPDDFKAAFNIFCCSYGIGTLGMPGNFSRSGPTIATLALIFMSFANIYASICLSKVMLLAPRTVKNFGDIGEWCMGKWGRALSIIAQLGCSLLTPCAFLVLGGSLLDGLFPDAFNQSFWIVFMALLVLPVCLIPTLKEGAGVAFAGCLGTIIADIIGVAVVMHGMRGHPSVPFPEINFSQVAGMFGNLSLAYGAGIVIPDVQRQHSVPTRMPKVVCATVTFISCLFLTLASTGYSAVGCQISGNLLFTIYPDSVTGLSDLGFASDWGAVVLAYIFMQLHITIAFSVILNPAFFICERLVLGMHKSAEVDIENAAGYIEAATPVDHSSTDNGGLRTSKASYLSTVSHGDAAHEDDAEVEAAQYRGGANVLKYIGLRIAIVAVLVIASVLWKDHFGDLADFVGASCITANCIVLPIAYYYIKAWDKVSLLEKIPGFAVFVSCFVLGCYVTYTTGKALFSPVDDSVNFPFCSAEYENDVYYNYTAVHG